jgi:replicative DNA helicase
MSLDRAAEQALIGAVLLQPSQYDEVREWLTADDFDGTAERRTYEAIESVATREGVISPAAVDRGLRSQRSPASDLADGAFVVGCMQRCPEATRAAVYGRMVLELSIRRRVSAQASGLRQRAENAVSSNDLTLVFAGVDAVRRDIERLHQRESKAARSHSPTPLVAGELKPLRRPQRHDEAAAERAAVAALVDDPTALTRVTRWLSPRDFGDAECAGLYSELTVLHNANNPIDPLTLAWRAKRVGINGPACDSLLAFREPTSADAVVASRRVLEQSVRAAVVATADELGDLADDGRVNTTSQAYARLNNLWPQQRRLVRAGLAAQ